jgi:NAD(P)-dependent dehydrogenase (short-subunit alcohol dehydrogenase family)
MSGPLSDRVIVVMGGTTGLGLSGAKACVEAGARIVVVGRNPDNVAAAITTLGSDAEGMSADAGEPATAEKAISKAVQQFGKLDGLYHVAGGSGRGFGDGPLDEITDEGWDATLKINLTSMFYSNRAAARQFLTQSMGGSINGGSILNMGSVLAHSPSPQYFATHAYATTKAAIEGLTTAAAAYYARRQIRFNVVAPALVETPMAQRAAQNDEIRQYIFTKQPLDGGRIGTATDLDAAVVYFLSDQSRFVTGQVLAVDGGWSVTEGQHPH